MRVSLWSYIMQIVQVIPEPTNFTITFFFFDQNIHKTVNNKIGGHVQNPKNISTSTTTKKDTTKNIKNMAIESKP